MKKVLFGLIVAVSMVACTEIKKDDKKYFVNVVQLDKQWIVKDFGNQLAVLKAGGAKGTDLTTKDTVVSTVIYTKDFTRSDFDFTTVKKYWVEVEKKDPADSSRLIKSVDSVYLAFIYGSKADSILAAKNRKKALQANGQ